MVEARARIAAFAGPRPAASVRAASTRPSKLGTGLWRASAAVRDAASSADVRRSACAAIEDGAASITHEAARRLREVGAFLRNARRGSTSVRPRAAAVGSLGRARSAFERVPATVRYFTALGILRRAAEPGTNAFVRLRIARRSGKRACTAVDHVIAAIVCLSTLDAEIDTRLRNAAAERCGRRRDATVRRRITKEVGRTWARLRREVERVDAARCQEQRRDEAAHDGPLHLRTFAFSI
jgi:hypothetical protein